MSSVVQPSSYNFLQYYSWSKVMNRIQGTWSFTWHKGISVSLTVDWFTSQCRISPQACRLCPSYWGCFRTECSCCNTHSFPSQCHSGKVCLVSSLNVAHHGTHFSMQLPCCLILCVSSWLWSAGFAAKKALLDVFPLQVIFTGISKPRRKPKKPKLSDHTLHDGDVHKACKPKVHFCSSQAALDCM